MNFWSNVCFSNNGGDAESVKFGQILNRKLSEFYFGNEKNEIEFKNNKKNSTVLSSD